MLCRPTYLTFFAFTIAELLLMYSGQIMSAITKQILNNLALKKSSMEFNSTATFAFESVAKRHGENTCFSHRDFKSTHQSEY